MARVPGGLARNRHPGMGFEGRKLVKTLDAEWKHFLKLGYDKERLKPFQELCLKRAFYGGVLTALTSCMEASRNNTEKEAGEMVRTILKECMDTCVELTELDFEKPENN